MLHLEQICNFGGSDTNHICIINFNVVSKEIKFKKQLFGVDQDKIANQTVASEMINLRDYTKHNEVANANFITQDCLKQL